MNAVSLSPAIGLVQRRPRVSRAVARAVDRMSRRAHAFHRFAHHPLCGRYESELVQLGRRSRVCRGCLMLGAGLAVGFVLGAVTRAALVPLIGEGGALGLALTAALPLRRPKSLKRFIPGLALGAVVAHGPLVWSLSGLALFGAGWIIYRQRGPDRTPCQTCPERTLPVCSGFRPLYRRERAVQRWARKVLNTAG